MIYKTKKCPNCSFVIQSHQPSIKKYGSPLQRCPRCKQYYVDDDYEEYAIKNTKSLIRQSAIIRRIISIPLKAIVFFAIELLIVVIFKLYEGKSSSDIELFIVMGVIALIISIILYAPTPSRVKSDIGNLDRIWDESNERLSNQQYAILLEKIGFDVPLRYLPEKMQKEKQLKKKLEKEMDPYDYYLYTHNKEE